MLVDIWDFLPRLLGYSLVLAGTVACLGAFYRLCRYNRCLPRLASACASKVLLAAATLALLWVLARVELATLLSVRHPSTLDHISLLAYVVTFLAGIKQVYDNRHGLGAWALSKTLRCGDDPCRDKGGDCDDGDGGDTDDGCDCDCDRKKCGCGGDGKCGGRCKGCGGCRCKKKCGGKCRCKRCSGCPGKAAPSAKP